MTTNILFSFVGETPQVVTETLYCLLRDYNTLVGKVHLLTTINMEENAFGLIKEWIERFNDEYGTEWKPCMDADFAWANHEGGVQVIPIEDINNEEANDKTIDAITRIIYYWTSQDDVNLCVSVAGGRKQLGSYMYQALSWFGQPDRTILCHVIPSKELEGGNPDGWIGGYFPEPGIGESSCAKADSASHDEYVNFVEQPVIYLQHFLPSFIKMEGEDKNQYKFSNFDNPYLDGEILRQEEDSFPFNMIKKSGDYLTFKNIFNRFRFIQGLSKNSPDKVKVILCPAQEKNFVVKTSGLQRSINIDSRYLFLFYFLYSNDYYTRKEFVSDMDQHKRLDLSLDWFLGCIQINYCSDSAVGMIGFDIEGSYSWCKDILLLSNFSYESYISKIDNALKFVNDLHNGSKDENHRIKCRKLLDDLQRMKTNTENFRDGVNRDEVLENIMKYIESNFSLMEKDIKREFAPSGLKINAPTVFKQRQHFRKIEGSDNPDLLEVLRQPGDIEDL